MCYHGQAGIRVWVITGDKQDTAINIGYSSRLLTPSMRVVTINAETSEECLQLLNEELKELDHLVHTTSSADLKRSRQGKDGAGKVALSLSQKLRGQKGYETIPGEEEGEAAGTSGSSDVKVRARRCSLVHISIHASAHGLVNELLHQHLGRMRDRWTDAQVCAEGPPEGVRAVRHVVPFRHMLQSHASAKGEGGAAREKQPQGRVPQHR